MRPYFFPSLAFLSKLTVVWLPVLWVLTRPDIVSILADNCLVSGIRNGYLESSWRSRVVGIVEALNVHHQLQASGHPIFGSQRNAVKMFSGVVRGVQVDRLGVDKVQVGSDEAAGSIVGDRQIGVVEFVGNIWGPFLICKKVAVNFFSRDVTARIR